MIFNKNLGFFSSNLDNYIEQINKGDDRYLSLIFCVFAEDSAKHKSRAAQVLNEVFNEFSFDDLYRIDAQMRETTSMESSINWSALNIKHFITEQMSVDEKRAVFIFASFNPNGYIREQAVEALTAYKETLAFILLRCNDWVYQVRQSALLFLSKILVNASNEEIVNALPLMEKLRRSGRCEYNNILSIIASVFESNKSLINKGLRSQDMRARRFCISFLNNMPKIEFKYLLNYIRYEKDPFLRKMIFQILLKANSDIKELSKQFLKDKYPPNRILSLQYLYDNKVETVFYEAERMLMDRNAQVRTLARSIVLQTERQFDIRQCYLDNLSTSTAISLYGLGEVGFHEDCNLVEEFLLGNCNEVVRAAMTVLMRLDSATFVFRITEMLSSEHSGIVKTATLLLKKYKEYDFERIFQIQENSSNENTKIKCASLLFLSPKWKSLIYTLMLIGSGYEKLEILCQTQLNRWDFSYNRSFAVLSENDKRVIKELLIGKKRFIKPETIKEILFLSK